MMGYYEILTIIERLDKDNLDISPIIVADNLPIRVEAVRRVFKKMVEEGVLQRRVVYLKEGKRTFYLLRSNSLTEGFINDFFKVITSIIH